MAEVDNLIAEYLIPDEDGSRPDNWLYRVLLAVADSGSHGATDNELVDTLQPPGGGNNIRPRRGDLIAGVFWPTQATNAQRLPIGLIEAFASSAARMHNNAVTAEQCTGLAPRSSGRRKGR